MARCASDPCTRWLPGVLAGLSGVTIDDRWFCSQACVERMVHRMIAEPAPAPSTDTEVAGVPHLRLGVLLRHHGALSADQLHQALEHQRTSGLKLGAQARALFNVDPTLVLKALAAQSGARYLMSIDPAMVHDAPGGLPREAVAALGLIPFSEPSKANIVRVASTAPVKWDAVGALRRLVGWEPEPYLVEDDMWHTLLAHYGAAKPATSEKSAAASAVLANGPREAVTQIASMAVSARRARLAEVRWDPYTWVRVEGGATVQDVLFARSAAGATDTAGESSWQAVNTSR